MRGGVSARGVLLRCAKTAQLGEREPTEVGWWSAFIENLERYDKTNTRGRRHKGSVGIMGLSAIPVPESSRKIVIRVLKVENDY